MTYQYIGRQRVLERPAKLQGGRTDRAGGERSLPLGSKVKSHCTPNTYIREEKKIKWKILNRAKILAG